MNYEEKIEFIEDILDVIRVDMLKRVNRMPEEWGGNQIRQNILDYVQEQVVFKKMDAYEKKNYTNDVMIHNL